MGAIPGALEQVACWYPNGPGGATSSTPGKLRLSMKETDAIFWAVPVAMVAHENMTTV